MDLADLLDELGASHTVTIEPHAGSGAYGDVFGRPVQITPCIADQGRKLMRLPTGSTVVSMSRVYAPLATVCPDRSRVTLPDGQQTLVITTLRRDGGGLDVPEHLEIVCE
ncbi:hypothetical protein [Dactylosporangium salmoneum]|uniref:Head-tail adaptor protein n=1 Tax=Dactylosporangium salmoneum TaxID=53361 RepID=A0ABP5SB44_9ACTN